MDALPLVWPFLEPLVSAGPYSVAATTAATGAGA